MSGLDTASERVDAVGAEYVTTSRRGTETEVAEARELAALLGIPFRLRTGPLSPEDGPVLVVTKGKLLIETHSGPLFFHPGMAKPRIRAFQQGRRDVMAAAMGLEPGLSVLDCTLGLGADAIVTSFVVGATGRVVGLETVPALAEVVRRGMATYDFPHADIVEAMRRIQVVHGNHRRYLAALDDNSFDVVYFDPLFRDPVQETIHMQPWRELGSASPLTESTLMEARRVARRRVVVKERSDGGVFEQLGIERIEGGKGSRIAYGILEAKA